MSADHAFDTLKDFFITRQASRQALRTLKEGVEISVVIDHSLECAVFRLGDDPQVERRAARSPDVEFHLRPETVYVLADQTKDEIGEIGIAIFKEVLAGNIQVRVPGQILNVVRNGYFEMMKQGGTPLASMMSRYGVGNVPKIISIIKGMRR
jgi:hypothetical protein